MKLPFKSLLLAASVSSLAMAPMAIGVVTLMPDPAVAQGASGNAGGGGRGNSGEAPGQSGDRGASASARANSGGAAAAASNAGGRGALASELQGLNAANASPQALANAAPNSQVGRIAIYRDAALAAEESREASEAVEAALNDEIALIDAELDVRTSSDLEDQLAKLQADEEATEEDIAALQAEFNRVRDLEAQIVALDEEIALAGREYLAQLEEAEEALLAASNGRTLSPEAREELHRLLGL